MRTPYEQTQEFHQIFDPRIPKQPTAFDAELAEHRAEFKIEEITEFLYAAVEGEPERFAEQVVKMHQALDRAAAKIEGKQKQITDPLVDEVDALTDLLYLTYGSFIMLGVDPAPIFTIVHEANMGKLFPDGQPHYDPITEKVLKPADWEAKYAPEERIRQALTAQKNSHKNKSPRSFS